MNEASEKLIAAIDNLLPQTQCQQCQYSGCQPYAEAIVNQGEKINRCVPGGEHTLQQLAKLLGVDAEPLLAEMPPSKPPSIAIIREDQCIGCTKCIQACPVDAIIGASQQMHTIITDACTGCGLCISPCPVDCIDLIPNPYHDETKQQKMAKSSRHRYQLRQQRQARQQQAAKLTEENEPLSLSIRQTAIQAAVERVKAKKKSLA